MTPEQKDIIKQLAQMGNVVIISDNKRINLDENGNISLKSQADAVLFFLQRLDIEMVFSILNDKYVYQQHKKSVFSKKLAAAFEVFIETLVIQIATIFFKAKKPQKRIFTTITNAKWRNK